jgi:DNA-binding LacI/PurR family transcriptional regulator
MEEEKFPFIVLGEPNNIYDVNWIDIDNKLGGEIGTEHLIQEGYENIAFVSGSLQDTFNQHRLEGFKKIMNKYVRDLEFEKFVYDGVSTQEEGIQMIQKLFEQNQKTDAIIFTDNIAAFGAIKWLKEQGYQIPKDVGIISFDDYPIAELTDPKLTTVDIDVLDLGMQAGMMLLKEIEIPSESKKHSLLSVKLIQRESSKRRK